MNSYPASQAIIIELPCTIRGFIYALVMIRNSTRIYTIYSTSKQRIIYSTVLDALVHDCMIFFRMNTRSCHEFVCSCVQFFGSSLYAKRRMRRSKHNYSKACGLHDAFSFVFNHDLQLQHSFLLVDFLYLHFPLNSYRASNYRIIKEPASSSRCWCI